MSPGLMVLDERILEGVAFELMRRVLLSVIPRRMEMGMPEMGTERAEERVEARVNPAVAVAADSVTPGSIEVGGFSVLGGEAVASSSFLGGGGVEDVEKCFSSLMEVNIGTLNLIATCLL